MMEINIENSARAQNQNSDCLIRAGNSEAVTVKMFSAWTGITNTRNNGSKTSFFIL